MNLTFAAAFVFLGAVTVNALLAGYQTGFLIVDRIRLRYLAEEEKDPRAGLLLERMNRPDWLYTSIRITTATALILGTVVLSNVLIWDFLVIFIAPPIFLVFSEIIPRSVFRRHPEKLSLALSPVLRFFEIAFAPLIRPAVLYARLLRRLTRASVEETDLTLTSEADFRLLVDESAAAGSIEKEEQELIHNVMDLQSTPAKDIMIPRVQMKVVSDHATRAELIALFQETNFTRIPVFHETIDTITGVANVYDVLLDSDPLDAEIGRFIKPIPLLPDTMHAADVLKLLKDSRQHMAIVIDEYGVTDGLITLEDVLEEIFGDIQDEHDRTMDRVRKVAPHGYVVDARMTIDELRMTIQAAIPEHEAETVAGWVIRMAGRIPEQGEKVKRNGFRVTVLEGKHNQITKIRLDVLPEARGTTAVPRKAPPA